MLSRFKIGLAADTCADHSARQRLDLAADDVSFHLIDLCGEFRVGRAKNEARRLRSGLKTIREEARLPIAGEEPIDLVPQHVAGARDREGDIGRISAAAIKVTADDARATSRAPPVQFLAGRDS